MNRSGLRVRGSCRVSGLWKGHADVPSASVHQILGVILIRLCTLSGTRCQLKNKDADARLEG